MHAPAHLRSIGYALAAFTFWVGTDTCMKLAGETGLPPTELIALMGLTSVIILAFFYAPRGGFRSLIPRNRRQQSECAAYAIICTLSNAVMLNHMSLTLFYIIVFSGPLAIAILSYLILDEKLSPLKIVCVVAGFVGVIIAINPFTADDKSDWIGYGMGIISVMTYALWMVRSRVMSQSETLQSMSFFSAFLFAAGGLTLSLFHFVIPAIAGLAAAFGAGLTNLGGNLTIAKALRHTTTSNVAQIHYTQIITGGLVAYSVWHDVPTLHLLAGAVIIIASGLVIAREAHRSDRIAA